MLYRVEGATLVTDQSTNLRVEITNFEACADGILQLEFGASLCSFKCISALAFEISQH